MYLTAYSDGPTGFQEPLSPLYRCHTCLTNVQRDQHKISPSFKPTSPTHIYATSDMNKGGGDKVADPFPGVQHPLLLSFLVPPAHADHVVAQPGDGVVPLVPVAHLVHRPVRRAVVRCAVVADPEKKALLVVDYYDLGKGCPAQVAHLVTATCDDEQESICRETWASFCNWHRAVIHKINT